MMLIFFYKLWSSKVGNLTGTCSRYFDRCLRQKVKRRDKQFEDYRRNYYIVKILLVAN